jgi:hypothetical protein
VTRSRRVLLVTFAASVAVACASVLGLDDVRYGSEDGGRLADARQPSELCVAGGEARIDGQVLESDRVYCARFLDNAGNLGPWFQVGTLPEGVTSFGYGQRGETWIIAGGAIKTGNTSITRIGEPADGGIAWRMGQSLASPRATHSLASGAGVFVAAGGNLDAGTSVHVSSDPDRSPWQRGPDLPAARARGALVASGAFFYLLGGSLEGGAVFSAAFDDGGLSAWSSLPALNPARESNFGFEYQGSIYVGGGLATLVDGGYVLLDDIQSAKVEPDGSLSPWTVAGKLPAPRQRASVIRVHDHLYVVGGSTSANPVSPDTEVRLFTLGGDGGIVDVGKAPPLPVPVWSPALFLRY